MKTPFWMEARPSLTLNVPCQSGSVNHMGEYSFDKMDEAATLAIIQSLERDFDGNSRPCSASVTSALAEPSLEEQALCIGVENRQFMPDYDCPCRRRSVHFRDRFLNVAICSTDDDVGDADTVFLFPRAI